MKKSKLEAAKSMAKAHSLVEPNLKRVCLIEPLDNDDPNDPIKLLEVVEGTLEMGIEPVAFTADPARGIEYPSIIVEISPDEYQEIRDLGFAKFHRKRVDLLGKKGSVAVAPKHRRALRSNVAREQQRAERRDGWTLGEELLAR